MVRTLALARHLDLEETAKLMAMAHVSGDDSAIGCWDAKSLSRAPLVASGAGVLRARLRAADP
jgi:hypothetical protein